MAAEGSLQDLVEEATCSICLDFFQDPVLVPECGHNFCRNCLTRSWGTTETKASCPQCRQTFGILSLLPNRQLARMVEMARQCGGHPGEEGRSLCPKHREPLKLFCKDHQTLICVVCYLSKEHRGHSVIPAEEAFQEYQIKVGDCLKARKEEKLKIATYKRDTEQRMQKMLDLIEKEKKNVVAEFRELQLWLKGQEKLLLTRMEETEKTIMARKEKGLAKHMEELGSLDHLIQEIEEKHQQPASKLLQDRIDKVKKSVMAEFRELQLWLEGQEKLLLTKMEETEKDIMARKEKGLAKHMEELGSLDHLIQEIEEKLQQPANKLLQDIGSILKKYQAKETYENPVDLLLEPKWTVWDYSDMTELLKSTMKKLRDTLESGLQLQEENVTLDSGTAYPGRLEISEDRKSVKRVKPVEEKYLASDPVIFVHYASVLGCQKFSPGRHFWEIIVGGTGEWSVGVAKKPVNLTNLDEQIRLWEFVKSVGKYWAISSRFSELVLTEEPTRIRISLNCEGGQVSFFDASTATLLHTFSDASLVGETLLPFFSLGEDTSMTLP
ncbi:E3 ubiquitin-protein ligase TRIM39-like [Pituophis catenifer annectens]|uniref:E3 ubiquitin-protein ligase TRIM39-like n=1 Tax=Pituophis catenifer annectens TaxID=94852 RepID=UPI003991C0B2